MEQLFTGTSARETGKRQTTSAQPGPRNAKRRVRASLQADRDANPQHISCRPPGSGCRTGQGRDAQPGSLAVRGISCWQRAATVASTGEGREATRQQRSGGFVLRLQDCLKSPTSANISTAELLDNSAGGAPGNTQPEQNNFEGNYMSWDLVLSLSLVEEIIWPI